MNNNAPLVVDLKSKYHWLEGLPVFWRLFTNHTREIARLKTELAILKDRKASDVEG